MTSTELLRRCAIYARTFYKCATRRPYCGLPSLGSTDGSKPLLFTPLYSSPLAHHGDGSIHLSALRGPESSLLYAWYLYDMELHWDQREVQLYLVTFTGVPKAILCQACSSSGHITNLYPFPQVYRISRPQKWRPPL